MKPNRIYLTAVVLFTFAFLLSFNVAARTYYDALTTQQTSSSETVQNDGTTPFMAKSYIDNETPYEACCTINVHDGVESYFYRYVELDTDEDDTYT